MCLDHPFAAEWVRVEGSHWDVKRSGLELGLRLSMNFNEGLELPGSIRNVSMIWITFDGFFPRIQPLPT